MKPLITDEECDDEVGSDLRHVDNDAFLARCYRLSRLGLYRRSSSSRHHIVRTRQNLRTVSSDGMRAHRNGNLISQNISDLTFISRTGPRYSGHLFKIIFEKA